MKVLRKVRGFLLFLILFGTLVSGVEAVEAPYLYYVNDSWLSPIYSQTTTVSLDFSNLTVGNSLMVYDGSNLLEAVAVGATKMSFDFNNVNEASHSYFAIAIDGVGVTDVSNIKTYVVDVTRPTSPVLTTLAGSTGPITSSANNLSLLASDLETNTYLTVFDNGTTLVTDMLAVGSTMVINISAIGYGSHSYKIVAIDRAANESSVSNEMLYTMNGTNTEKLTTPTFLGNPLADGTFMAGRYIDPHYYPRNIWDMQIFGGKIYFGSGNSANSAPDSNWGPISLWHYNLGTTSFGTDQVINQVGTTTVYVDEDQVDKLRVLNGTLWTPGHDSRESWSLGNVYRYDNNGVWTKFRNVPYGVHVYDLAYLNGKIYTSLGTDGGTEPTIYESSDGGSTWTGVANTISTGSVRIYDLFVFNNELYALNYITYDTSGSNSQLYKFNGTSFTKYSVTGTNFIPQSSRTVPISGSEESFRMVRLTEFNSNLFFILANGSNDHQWSPLKLYKTSNMQNGTLINLANGAVPYDIRVDGGIIYVLAVKKLTDSSYVNYVFSSSNGTDWSEVFHFNYQTYAISFEKNGDDFYFGMGTGHPPLWAGSYSDTTHLSTKSGDVVEIKGEDYLWEVPSKPVEIGGLIGDSLVNLWWQEPLSNGGAAISDYKVEYKLSIGNSWSVFDDGVSIGTSATVTSLINSLNYDFRVSAINVIGVGITSETITLMPIGETTPTPTPTPTATPTPMMVGSTNIGDLFSDEVFVPEVGSSLTDTLKITVANETIINLETGSLTTTISLALNTEITRLDNQSFDANLISVENLAESAVSNFAAGFVPETAMQWGIPGATLVFSSPVTINMFVGTDLDGQTLNVFRSSSTSSGWTSEGIVSPATCVISGGYCQFSITEASYFTATSYQTPVSSSNNSSSNSSPSSSNYFCNDAVPKGNPDLFQIQASKGKVKLFYSPTTVATGYAVIYGLKKGDERFGIITQTVNNNKGVQSVEIESLNPKLTYYFKVAAINGCNAGSWSNWVPVKANKKTMIYKYKTIIKNKIKILVNRFN